MNSTTRTGIFWVVLGCVVVLLMLVARTTKAGPDRGISFSEFIREVEAGKIGTVSITDGTNVQGRYKDGAELKTLIPATYGEVYKILQDHGVEIEIAQSIRSWRSILMNSTPFLVLLAFWLYMMWQMQGRRPGGSSGTGSLSSTS